MYDIKHINVELNYGKYSVPKKGFTRFGRSKFGVVNI
jgi:hypothetical protein